METPAGAPAFVPKVKKLLTRPVLKLMENQPRYVLIEREIYLGKDMKSRAADVATGDQTGRKKKDPAHLIDAIDLTTGSEVVVIASAVVNSTLTEEYPLGSYVGKSFEIMKLPRKEGKEYFPYKVAEIETPDALAPVAKKAEDELKKSKAPKPEVAPTPAPAPTAAPEAKTAGRSR